MNKRLVTRIACLLCVAALSCGLLFGCAGGASNAANQTQQANRAYMSQVNQLMDELGDRLDSFVDAVSRGDVVNMRSQADEAYKTLDKLAAIEAPEALADVQEKYVSGTTKLREALDAYIVLYSSVASQEGIDQGEYDSQLAEIQALYDEGVALLEEADETAANLPE